VSHGLARRYGELVEVGPGGGSPLAGAWMKVRWAEVSLCRLRQEASEFFGDPDDPASLRGVLASGSSRDIKQDQLEPPWHWALMVGDIVQSFRASLDYLVWELSVVGISRRGGKGNPGRTTAFPLVSKPGSWSDEDVRMAHLDPEQRRLIETFQPYNDPAPTTRPTGKRPLDRLRDLSNKDKHRALSLVIGRAGFVEQSLEYGSPGWAFIVSSETHTARIIGPDERVKSELEMRTAFYMELEKDGRIDWILDGIGSKVSEIVRAFEPAFEG
jgi:hypothetical protein